MKFFLKCNFLLEKNKDNYLKTIMEDEIQIKIKMTSNAQVYTIKVLKSDTIQTLKEKCEKETSIPPKSQNLVYKGRILSNEKLVSDYKIENDHTIILVKKHTSSQPTTAENKTNTQNTSTNNNNTSTNSTNTNNNNNNSNNNNNNQNPFMGFGGQMPDLSQLGSLMGNIDPNILNNMMQNLGNGGGLGNMGINPQMMSQILSNPMYIQMMQNMLQNPQMLQMALNSPQMRQLAQNNPQMQAMLNNPQLLQQMLNPQTLQMMSNMFQSMSGNNGQNTNNNNNANGQMPPFDLGQMANLFGNMGGLFGNLNNNNNNGGNGTGENFSNIGINDNNDANVDYKEKYKDQLAQMKDMGFVNEETNIQVLKQCSGNVQFAVERLLNMLG